LAADPAMPQLYRDLATLKAMALGAGEVPPDERITALEPLSAPGGAFRSLALEQIALAHAEAGRPDEAIAILTALLGAADGSATRSAARRADDPGPRRVARRDVRHGVWLVTARYRVRKECPACR
jgi:hypothetical protein